MFCFGIFLHTELSWHLGFIFCIPLCVCVRWSACFHVHLQHRAAPIMRPVFMSDQWAMWKHQRTGAPAQAVKINGPFSQEKINYTNRLGSCSACFPNYTLQTGLHQSWRDHNCDELSRHVKLLSLGFLNHCSVLNQMPWRVTHMQHVCTTHRSGVDAACVFSADIWSECKPKLNLANSSVCMRSSFTQLTLCSNY